MLRSSNHASAWGPIVVLLLAGLFLTREWRSPSLLNDFLTVRLPDDPDAAEWLRRFRREQQEREQRQPQALAYLVPSQGTVPPSSCNTQGPPPNRTNLVVATVGDGWEPSRWLSQPAVANFDLAVLYYGSKSFNCSQCSHVIYNKGPKWYLYHSLTQSKVWRDILERGYDYVMFPDDDLRLDTCQISTFFNVAKEFSVLLAQPSVCNGEGSYTWWMPLYQQQRYRLRFVQFVEIMAPAIRMDFFQEVVRHTLTDTFVGYALDFIWPALLGWPRDKVAVVDELCMVHPPSPEGGKPGGLYDVSSRFSKESTGDEMKRTLRRYNYHRLVVLRHGMSWDQPVVFGGVLRQGISPTAEELRAEKAAGSSLVGQLSARAPWVWLGAATALGALVWRTRALARLLAWLKWRQRAHALP